MRSDEILPNVWEEIKQTKKPSKATLVSLLCVLYLNDLASLTVAAGLQEGEEQDVKHGHLSSLLTHKIHG